MGKGLAISFVTSSEDEEVLEKVRQKFVVPIPDLPEKIDSATYSTTNVITSNWYNSDRLSIWSGASIIFASIRPYSDRENKLLLAELVLHF